MQKQIREKNATLIAITGAELEVAFNSPFNTVQGTLIALTGVVGHLGSIIIGKSIKAYKINKVIFGNFLKLVSMA